MKKGDERGGLSSQLPRLNYLDAIRGVAAMTAMAILLHHSIDIFVEVNLPRVLECFNLGKFGGFLFFAFSGVVIPFVLKSKNVFFGVVNSTADESGDGGGVTEWDLAR